MNRDRRHYIHPPRLHREAAVAVNRFPPELVTALIVAQAAAHSIGKGKRLALVCHNREIPVNDVTGALIGDGECIWLFAEARPAVAVAAAVGQGPVI